jgi:hypothetical protein
MTVYGPPASQEAASNTMFTIRPVTSRILRRLAERPFSQIAEETKVLSPGRTWTARPIIHLPDTWDRLIAHSPYAQPEKNNQQIVCKDFPQGQTIAYRFKDVLIADGAVMGSAWTQSITQQKRRPVIKGSCEYIGDGALCSTPISATYFGHWLHDQLPHEVLASELNLQPLTVKGAFRPNERGYRAMTNLHAQEVDTARVENLWMFSDHELNDHRVRRIEEVRGRIRSAVPSGGPKRVFIGRGPSAVGRALLNEAEIAAAMEAVGVAYLVPEQMEPAEIAWSLRDAEIVFGPEGSALAHAICAMPHGSTFFTIMPPRQFNLIFRLYAEAIQVRYALDFGSDAGEDSFTMPVDRIMRMLDRIEKEAS